MTARLRDPKTGRFLPGRVPRREADARELEAIAYVCDSGGKPVLRDAADPKSTIGIYRQHTGTPADDVGRHLLWLSDEPHGLTYPFDKDVEQEFQRQTKSLNGLPAAEAARELRRICDGLGLPYYLRRFMFEAGQGEVSAAYAPTAWGRAVAVSDEYDARAKRMRPACVCNGGRGPRWGRDAAPTDKTAERGGMNSREAKKARRRAARAGGAS